jgi:beta-glucosidase
LFVSLAECLHGAVDFLQNSSGHTEFPEPMGLAATFDSDLLHRVGDAIGNEVRAKFNEYNATLQSWRYALTGAPTHLIFIIVRIYT